MATNIDLNTNKNWFSKHMILGILFVVLALAAIISGIYYWKTVSAIPATVQFPEHKEKVDSTADWKTYTNSEYGIEFKYPNDWNMDPSAESAQDIYNGDKLYTSFVITLGPPKSLQDYTAGIVISHTMLDYDNQPSDKILAIVCKSDKTGCMKNQNGVYYNKSSGIDEVHGQYDLSAYIPTANKILVFYEELKADENSKPVNASIEKTFDQILSTFKFTK